MIQYLKLLGLGPRAELNDVKKAYRLLAKENHPDLFINEKEKKEQAEKMAQINEAYRLILSEFSSRKKEARPDTIEAPAAENDYTIYKKGVEYFNKYSGSISLKFKNNTYDMNQLLEKKKDIEKAKECFERLLREYPESDWAYDSEERLKKIKKSIGQLEENITASQTQTLGWTKKGTPYWKKNP